MRCDHENVEIIEHGTMYTSHARDENGEWSEWQDVGNYSDKITIKCPDCNYYREISRCSKHLPKWIKNHLIDLKIID